MNEVTTRKQFQPSFCCTFIYHLHCGKILLRAKQETHITQSLMHAFSLKKCSKTKKQIKYLVYYQTSNFSQSVWFLTRFFVCQKSKNPSRSILVLEAQFKPKWTWKHWKQCKSRVYFEQKRRSMITKQVNCAATNKEVYEATNQPQCYFFW